MKRKFTKYPSNITASTWEDELNAGYSKWINQYGYDKLSDKSDDELDEMLTNVIDEREGVSDDEDFERGYYLDNLYMDLDNEIGLRKQRGSWMNRDIDACDKVTSSSQLPANLEDTIYDLYQIAVTWRDSSEVDLILINNGTSPDSRFIIDENTNVMQAYNDLIDYIKNNINPDILNEREYALVYGNDVEACDKVEATTEPKYFANMVNASRESMLFTSNCKYYVGGYADGNKRVLISDFDTDDFDGVIEGAHDMACRGLYVVIKNQETGSEIECTPDTWMESIDLGGVPEDIYSVM